MIWAIGLAALSLETERPDRLHEYSRTLKVLRLRHKPPHRVSKQNHHAGKPEIGGASVARSKRGKLLIKGCRP